MKYRCLYYRESKLRGITFAKDNIGEAVKFALKFCKGWSDRGEYVMLKPFVKKQGAPQLPRQRELAV